MPTIFFIEATDGPGVKAEVVKDLRERAKAQLDGAKRTEGKAKSVAEATAAALAATADHWEQVFLGNPLAQQRPAQSVQAPTPVAGGGRSNAA